MASSTTRVPEKVRDLTTRRRLSPSARPNKLTEPQRRALQGMLTGDVVPDFTPNFINVMDILIHADDTPETVEAIGAVLDDPWRSPAERAFAAVALRRSDEPGAPRILVDHLDVDDPSVRIQVVRSLAAIGTRDQLDRIQEVEAEPGSALEKQLAFAREVIAHRAGLELGEPTDRRGVTRRPGEPEDMIELTLRPITKKTLAAERVRLDGTVYQLPIGERGFRLTAGKAEWTVLTNADMSAAGGYGAMFTRPWLTAVLARIDSLTQRSSVQYVVLSHPSGRGARINVFRTDGELMYTGTMKRAKDLLEFSIRDVARRATAPTNISGRITKQGPVLDLTVPFGTRQSPQIGNEGVPIA